MEIAQTRQLRLNFLLSETKLRAKLSLKGLVVGIESEQIEILEQYLANQQFLLSTSLDGRRSFMVGKLDDFLLAAALVEIVLSSELKVFVKLIEFKKSSKHCVLVTLDSPVDLNLNFELKSVIYNEYLSIDFLPAFLSFEVPYTGSTQLLNVVKELTNFPYLVGHAMRDIDGFLRIEALSPQLLIEEKLPGLFRVDDKTYGLANSYQNELESVRGIVIDYKMQEESLTDSINLPYELTKHSEEMLASFEERLLKNKSQVVVWGKGLGRRVFSLSVMEALKNYPLLIVTQSSGIWAWKRHIDMIGRKGSITSQELEIQIVTYEDIRRGVSILSPRAIIFDDIDAIAGDASMLTALKIMDGVMDAYRIGCCSKLSESTQVVRDIMSIVKPFEFEREMPLVDRYPLNPELAFKQHTQPYILRADYGLETVSQGNFKRSTVEVVECSAEFMEKLNGISEREEISFDLMSKLMETMSAGTDDFISPKISRVCELVHKNNEEGEMDTIICTRFTKSQRILEMILGEYSPRVLTVGNFSSKEKMNLAILKFDEILPDLSKYKNVIILDYPWSLGVIDKAVGSSDSLEGSHSVSLIHLRGSIDDRLSIFAARRTEVTLLGIDYHQPSFAEVKYILSSIK